MSSKLRPVAYTDVDSPQSSLSEEEERGVLLDSAFSKEYSELSAPLNTSRRRPWFFTALTSTLLILSLVCNALQWRASSNSRCIFPTDIKDGRRAIEYEQRTYTGALVYDEEQKTIIRRKDAEVEYFGPPSQEIEDAWSDMMRNEYPRMTDEEAAPFLPELLPLPTTGHYHFEPDMFHTLHCLNAVRLEVSKTLYPNSTFENSAHHHPLPPDWEAIHMEHCMDRIRQTITCFGDMAPSPMYYWKGFNIVLGRSGEHTCRKWQPIRNWMDERHAIADDFRKAPVT